MTHLEIPQEFKREGGHHAEGCGVGKEKHHREKRG